jgi:hypothetical protein
MNHEKVPEVIERCEDCEEREENCFCYCDCGKKLILDDEKDLGVCRRCQ